MKRLFVLSITLLLLIAVESFSEAPITWAGARSSIYGAVPFPEDSSWSFIMKNMVSKNNAEIPVGIWIVGHLDSRDGSCFMEFEKPDTMTTVPEYVKFVGESQDWEVEVNDHEATLNYFDANGVKVFLQVEPGLADLPTLMDIVMEQYRHHESVIGFGFDIEWFNVPDDEHVNGGGNGYSNKVNYELASSWNAQLKGYDSNYQFFLKHWLTEYLAESPSDVVDDILYIDDSQGFGYSDEPLSEMENEYAQWASYFDPAPVGYQIGYEQDSDWWPLLDDPLENIAGSIKWAIDQNGSDQKLGMFWVDFTLYHDSIPEIWDNNGYSNINVGISGNSQINSSVMNVQSRSGEIQIDFQQTLASSVSIELYDLSGRQVRSYTMANANGLTAISTANLSQGCYLLQINSGSEHYAQSVIIQ